MESAAARLASWNLVKQPSCNETENKCFIAIPVTYPLSNCHGLHPESAVGLSIPAALCTGEMEKLQAIKKCCQEITSFPSRISKYPGILSSKRHCPLWLHIKKVT